jgi:hypothetical protein
MATNANICGLVKGVINEAKKYNDIENKCACCFEPTLTKSFCGHHICLECYDEWTKNKTKSHTCPTCRGEYEWRKIPYNTFMKYAKNYMRKLKCELCEKLKCECSVIDKTFYNAIPPTIYAEFRDDKNKFYRQHRDILDEYLITEFIYGECGELTTATAEKKIKITFWGKNKFTIYKKGEDWKEGITINYCVFQDDLIRDIDGEMLNTLTLNTYNRDIKEFLKGYDVNMTEIAISLLKNAGGYHLCDFLSSPKFYEENSWIENILEFKLYKNWNEFPYTIINDFDDNDYLKSCDYSERYAYIYEASDDLMNGIMSVEYDGECDESEESEESEEDEEIDWEKEEREINDEEESIRDKEYHLNLDGEDGNGRRYTCEEMAKINKKNHIRIIELEKRKLRLAKFKLASKNALFKIIKKEKLIIIG